MLCDSRSAFSACVDNSPVNLFAGPGDVCIVSGESYNGAGTNIAVQASGLGATITWTSVGLSKILTSGAGLPAAQADDGGSIAITGGSIETSGAAAPAILSKGGEGGSSVTLSGGTTILTVGDGSAGLAVSGSGASLTAAGADPSAGVDVKTLGVGSIGATNGFGSGLEPGGTMNLTHTTIVTEGQDAHAVAVSGAGSETHLGAENALTTQGDGAIGIYATGGGVVNGTGGVVTITTSGANSEATGLSAFGVNADGPGSQVNLPGLIVTTAGANAYGLYASDGGAINAEDGPSIATHGAGAIGVYASGAGSSIAVGGGATIATDSAPAAEADKGALLTLSGASLTTSGNGSARTRCQRLGFAGCAQRRQCLRHFRPGVDRALRNRRRGRQCDWGGHCRDNRDLGWRLWRERRRRRLADQSRRSGDRDHGGNRRLWPLRQQWRLGFGPRRPKRHDTRPLAPSGFTLRAPAPLSRRAAARRS